jgi:hypothetical protein
MRVALPCLRLTDLGMVNPILCRMVNGPVFIALRTTSHSCFIALYKHLLALLGGRQVDVSLWR